MAKNGTQPIQEYIDTQRKKGFQKKEIVDRLKKAGYDEESINNAYRCHHQQHWILALSIICIILAISTALLYFQTSTQEKCMPSQTQYTPIKPSEVPQPSCPIFRAEPTSCMKMQGIEKTECLTNTLAYLDETYKEKAKPGSADYFVYSQEVSISAALLDDQKTCERLTGDDITRCIDYIPYLRATIGKDTAACERYTDENKYLNCYTESLKLNDPQRLDEFAAKFGSATKAVIDKGDLRPCQTLETPRIISACINFAYYSIAIRDKDPDKCSKIEDESYKTFCRSSVQQRLNQPPLPATLAPPATG